MTKPRIPPVEAPNTEQRELLAKTGISAGGKSLNIFGTLANHPALLRRINALGGVFLASGTLPVRVRELAILRVAAQVGSEYEFFHHTRIGKGAGLTGAEIAAIRLAPEAASWSLDDHALLLFVDELLESDDVRDEAWASLASRFDSVQLVELTLLVGFYRMLAGFLAAARVCLEELEVDIDVA